MSLPPSSSSDKSRVVAIVGPTAAGKSRVAMALARMLPVEIVSADSMQVYRGMDIGTAKPTGEDRATVSHHLLDVADISEGFSAARYQAMAREVVADVLRRSHTPVIVGGSGLYVRALLEDLDFAPGNASSPVRGELEERARALGAAALHNELAEVDAPAAAAIDARNVRRVVRALEAIYTTGDLWSERLSAWRESRPVYRATVVGLSLERSNLYAKIDRRVDRMMALGWVDEVRSLAERGLREAPTARRALGYSQLLEHLSGELSLVEAVTRTKRATRAFAKRQSTWFRADDSTRWLDAERPPEEIAGEIAMLTAKADLD